MPTVLADDVLSFLGNNRDILLLALAVLVLVEGAIIVLWARRAIHLQRELERISSEAANAVRTVAATAAAAAAEKASGVTMRSGERKVYSVAGRTTPLMGNALVPPSADTTPPGAPAQMPGAWQPANGVPAAPAPVPPAAHPAPPAAAASWTPPPAPAPASPAPPAMPAAPAPAATASWTAPSAPAPYSPPPPGPLSAAPEPPAPAEPPAEYVNPVVEQAAAWVLPEVEASRAPVHPEPPAAPAHNNGWSAPATPTDPAAPTTLGWSGTTVPVEPDADFAVITDPESIPAAPPARPAAAATPRSFTVLDGVPNGASTWAFAPTPALSDGGDDTLVDDRPDTGDILLVEDDPSIAKLYSVLLESRGYAVRHAVDGLDGLDCANQKRPDLVLLDIMMPRMNGIAFLQALRAGDMRDVPVVVLSNFMEKQLVDDAMSLGALEYMVKAQTRPEALVGALPHWLKGERAFTF
jgi:CheY-like chemotaxis protein